jgi:negative regulator of flagellin synthesis FlgM
MRIADKQVQQVIRAYGDQIRRQEKSAKPTENTSHEIRLSPESQEYLAAMQALRNLPEAEDARVEQLRQQLQAGTYQVDAKQIAQKLLERQTLDRRV